MGLQILIRESGDVTILDLQGRSTIDGGESELLDGHLRQLLANGVRKLLLNLVNLTQVDSSAVGAVVASDLVDYDSRDQAAKPGKTSQRAKVEKFFSFEASLSMRIEKGKLISWQVDDVRLTETDDVPDTLKHLP